MKRLVQTSRGIAALSGVVLATLIGFIPLLPTALVKILVPWQPVKKPMTHAVLWIARHWLLAINASLMGFSGARIHYDQQLADNPNGRYVLTSNHQSWIDVVLLCHLILPQFPFPRFFIKSQLRWLPIIGLACWALDFPFMKRYSREAIRKNPSLRTKDIETVRRSCEIFREWPVTLINYPEGTRSTATKRKAANSPYQTMLPPKAGGTAFAVKALGDMLDGVLDMTVAYVDTPTPRFWDFVCGRIPDIQVRVRQLDLPPDIRNGRCTSDAAYRQQFKLLLRQLWAEKDAEVAAIQDPAQPQTQFAPPTASAARRTA